MKKLIMLSAFALGSVFSYASNEQSAISDSSITTYGDPVKLEKQMRRIEVHEFCGVDYMITTSTIVFSEEKWYTEQELEARKNELKQMFPSTMQNGTGCNYHIITGGPTVILP